MNRPHITACVFAICLGAVPSVLVGQDQGVPLVLDEQPPELAGYMTQLQGYVHKLALSVDARNADLAGFYLHESILLLEEMQARVPEYEGVPIALYLDRMALPEGRAVASTLDQGAGEIDWPDASEQLDRFIESCNACHQASNRGYIRIARTTVNPFMQDFSVKDKTQ